MMWGSLKSDRAFTMVEILATIAILAVLIAVSIPIVGNYVEISKRTANRQTLAVLNDALTRYKTQGGDLTALTAGADIGRVLNLLQTPVTWAGVTHQFLKTGTTYLAASLDAVGSGSGYKFYGYGTFSLTTPDPDEPTSSNPYGVGAGSLTRSGTVPVDISILSSSGYVAYSINSGAPTIAASGSSNISVPANCSMIFWSCVGAADSTKSGSVTSVTATSADLTALYINSFKDIEEISCANNSLTSLKVSNLPKLRYLQCNDNNITSLDFSGDIALCDLVVLYNNNLTSIDLSDAVGSEFYFWASGNPNLSSVAFASGPFGANATLRLQNCPNITDTESALNDFYSKIPTVSSGTLWLGWFAPYISDTVAINKGWTVRRM